MEFDVIFPQRQIGTDPEAIRAYGEAAEAAGYGDLHAYDHVLGADVEYHDLSGPYDHEDAFHEPFVLFGHLAAVTDSLKFVTGILILPQRQTPLDRLHEFAGELAHHLHRQRLESVAPKGTILWEDCDEFLAQAETEIDVEGFHETGLVRFPAFGLQFLLTGRRYYLYSEELEAVSPAELCCHTLLIDDGSRYRSYCLLLLSTADIDEEDLREQAEKYGLEEEIDALLRYLETRGEFDDDRLPEWSEFRELAADYEVQLPQ